MKQKFTIIIFLALTCMSSYLAQGQCLVAYYPFIGNANDASGNSYNGIVYGATLTEDRFGNSNNAYIFDGTNYIESSPILPNSNQVRSISAWFNTISSSGYNGWDPNTIVSWGNGSSNELCAIIVYAGELMFNAFGDEYDVPTGILVNDGYWHHVVITYDGYTILIYLDNDLKISATRNFNTINSTLYIGKRQMPDSQNMVGIIDDIRIFNCVLDSIEIDSLYHENGWVGMNEFLSKNVFSIYPNPVNDYITIAILDNRIKDAKISVYDIQGQLVMCQKTSQQETTININALTEGMYFVKLERNKRTYASHFVKE